MATSNSVYEEIQFLCNKYHHGYVAPDEFVSTFNTAQRIFINRILGQVQEYQPGRPVARTGGHMTQVVEEKLAPFTKRAILRSFNEISTVKTQYDDFLKLLSLNTEDGTRVRRIMIFQVVNQYIMKRVNLEDHCKTLSGETRKSTNLYLFS